MKNLDFSSLSITEIPHGSDGAKSLLASKLNISHNVDVVSGPANTPVGKGISQAAEIGG